MRSLVVLSLSLLCLSSCGPTAVLVTDEVFRAAAPEVVSAWGSLPPFRDARMEAIAPGSGLNGLKTVVRGFAPAIRILVGVTLTVAERGDLVAGFPKTRFVFFAPDAPPEATITVRRAESWEVVARKAGAAGGSATVLFPSDASAEERGRFLAAWKGGGGGAITSWVWPEIGDLSHETGAVFQWAGPEADPRILALSAKVAVHGDPGTARVPGAPGLIWKIQEADLGTFLWEAAWTPEKKSHFLPLETVPASR